MSLPPSQVAYTSEALISDCVGRYITNGSGNVQLVNLINSRTYTSCWQAFVYWIASQYQTQSSANLAPIGVLTFTRKQAGTTKNTHVNSVIDNKQTTQAVAKFSFFRNFLDQYNLALLSNQPHNEILPSQDVSAQRMNLLSLSKLAGCETQTFRTALSHLMRRIGEVASSGEPFYIDIGIGALKGTKNTITMEFFEKFDTADTNSTTNAMKSTTSTQPLSSTMRTTALSSTQTISSARMIRSTTHHHTSTMSNTQGTALANTIIPKLDLPFAESELHGPLLPTASSTFRRKLPNGPLASARMVADTQTDLNNTGVQNVSFVPTNMIEDDSKVSPNAAYEFHVTQILERAKNIADTTGDSSILNTHQNTMLRKAPPTNAPPVLDLFARTQAATVSSSTAYIPPSTRIANIYTPSAAVYTITEEQINKTAVENPYAVMLQSIKDQDDDRIVLPQLIKQFNHKTAFPIASYDPRNPKPLLEYIYAIKCGLGNSIDILHYHNQTHIPLESLSSCYSLLSRSDLTPLRKQQLFSAINRSISRYIYYITQGIPTTSICPLDSNRIRSILTLLSTRIVKAHYEPLSTDVTTRLLSDLVQEITKLYVLAIKAAILDYTLLCPSQKIRLNISLPPPPQSYSLLWGYNNNILSAPLAWRPKIQLTYLTLSSSLHSIGSLPIELHKLATKYQDLLLFDVPQPHELPISLHELESRQKKHVTRVQKVLVTQWLEECEAVVRGYVSKEGLTDGSAVSLFEAISTLMGIQIRGIVQRSISACHAFFLQYSLAPLISYNGPRTVANITQAQWVDHERLDLPPKNASIEDLVAFGSKYSALREKIIRNAQCNTPKPAIIQTMEIRRARERSIVTLDSSYADINRTILAIMDRICESVRHFSRVEVKVFPLLRHNRGEEIPVWSEGELGTTQIQQMRQVVGHIVERSTRECQHLLQLYEHYEQVLDGEQHVDAWLSVPHTFEEYKQKILHYHEIAKVIRNVSQKVRCGFILIDCTSANTIIAQKAKLLGVKICDFVASKIVTECAHLIDDFKQARSVLLRKPSTAKDLHTLLAAFNEFVTKKQQILIAKSYEQRTMLLFLLEFELSYKISYEVLKSVGDVWVWTKQLKSLVYDCEAVCENERVRLEKILRERKLTVVRAADTVRVQCNQFKDMFETKRASEYITKIVNVQSSIERAKHEADNINEQEQLLGLQVSEFVQIDECARLIVPYEELWSLFVRWQAREQEWSHSYIYDLDAQQLESQVRNMHDTAVNVVAQLAHLKSDVTTTTVTSRNLHDKHKRDHGVYSVAETLRDNIAAFQPQVNLAQILCEPAMKDRHWDQICTIVGSQIRPDVDGRSDHITLYKLQEMGVHQYIQELAEVSEAAQKEGAVLTLVENMKTEWKDLALRVKPHKDTGCAILDNDSVEEVQQVLEEQIMKLGRVKGSVYARAHANDVRQWEHWLCSVQEAIHNWVLVQAEWVYMEPVFSTGEISNTLHAEAIRFAQADSQWRALMRDACIDLRVRSLSAIPHLSTILTTLLNDLNILHKSIQQYLSVKRDALPRLYLLSDEHLLNLLGQGDVHQAASQLQQCFEGVNSLIIEDQVIRGIISREGEKLPLLVGVDVQEAKGNAERWVGELESRMRESVSEHLGKSIRAYTHQHRNTWMFEWPAQVILCINHLLWTQSITECLSNTDGNTLLALTSYKDSLTKDLSSVVDLVRQPHDYLKSTLLSALLVMDVHNRDITQYLIDTKTTSLSSFAWTSQLRYYWELGNLAVRMVTTTIPYGAEYIGNTTRLVVTNLTDRCYRSLMMAMEVNAGGAPQGPAGTGKTETVKDLSKACGMQCLVFNCSDALDYKQMGNFFKGISGSGAWVCFDEFNRLQVEVLSVVAQQILSVQLAKEARVATFWLEGSLVNLRQSANIFITMNPGYAGRTELPDNLKALVRPVAMMVPDYTLIAQVTLFSCGFQHATVLANKITKTYKLCSEQLSSQSHYDYGMRAVKAVLSAADTLRKRHSDNDEHDILLTAIVQVNKPKFLQQDLPLFDSIIQDLFPGAKLLSSQSELRQQLMFAAQDLNLEPEDWLIDKCIELWEMLCIRHGVMIVAEGGTGKTSVWKTLQHALNTQYHGQLPHNHVHIHGQDTCQCGVETHIINPKSLTIAQLYGGLSPLTQEWSDGVLANKFRQLCSAPPGRKGWLMLDGPVDAQWIEDMNTVLDDNKKLCLMSGETIIMAEGMSLIVEVGDLSMASPATVSRCGMVLMERKPEMVTSVIKTWLKQVPVCSEGLEVIESVLFNVLIPLLKLVRGEANLSPSGANSQPESVRCEFILTMSDLAIVKNILSIYDAIMCDEWAKVRDPAAARAKELEKMKAREEEEKKSLSELQIARRRSLIESAVSMANLARRDSRRGSITTLGGLLANPSTASLLPQEIPTVLTMEQDPNLTAKLEGGLLFAIIWGLGATLKNASRDKFELAIREAMLGLQNSIVGICKGSVWNNIFDVERARWTSWLQYNTDTSVSTKTDSVFDSNLIGTKITVPTIPSVSITWFTETLLSNKIRTLLIGNSGTGKSLFAMQSIRALETKTNTRSIKICVCGTTNSTNIQNVIENNIERKRKGEYTTSGGRDLLIFLDDMHMASRDIWGVQSASELIRFFSEHNGIWDFKEYSMKYITGIRFLCSISSLGGGKATNDRFVRQWVPINLPNVDDTTLSSILTTVVSNTWVGAPDTIRNMITPIVAATKFLYTNITTKLLPTPSRAHYTFTSRDALKIITGVCRVNHVERDTVIRSWVHEAARIVCDRLITNTDRTLVLGWLEDAIEKKMGVDLYSIFAHLQSDSPDADTNAITSARKHITLNSTILNRLYYGSYADKSEYSEIIDDISVHSLENIWLQHQKNYNTVSKSPLSLVMFQYARIHLNRLCRVITSKNTHMVLMGERGSGRRSLATLACHSVGVELVTIDGDQHYDLEAWRKDLRSCMLRCGVRKKHVCLLLTESDMKRDGVMFDVNTLMNGGEIDKLWASEDIGEIVDALGDEYKRVFKTEVEDVDAIVEYFTSRVRDNLHIVCCISSDMNSLRERLRVYPSLATSTTIDYYEAWPSDALQRIALMHLERSNAPTLQYNRLDIAKVLVNIHTKVIDYHNQILAADANSPYKKVVISGGMFLECLKNTCDFLINRIQWYQDEVTRYDAGVNVIDRSAVSIEEMQQELEAMQPILLETTKETNAMLETVEQETKVALQIREKVKGEEQIAMDATTRARAMEAECEADLATVLPILERAINALEKLTLQDIAEVKAMRNPVKGVRIVMECVCHMKQIPPARIPDPSGSGKMITDYWEVAKRKVLSDTKLLQSLKQYDKENIPPKILKKMREFLELEDFNLEKLKSVSQAVYAVAYWIQSVESYNTIWKEVEPKREKLAEVRAECAECDANVAKLRAELAKVEANVDELTKTLRATEQKKASLEEKMHICQVKRERAVALLDGLRGERERWHAKVEEYTNAQQYLVGKCILSSALCTYAGWLDNNGREHLLAQWVLACTAQNIVCSPNSNSSNTYVLQELLSEEVIISEWVECGLPNDHYSIDNALMVLEAYRWPLIVDPHKQATKWLHNMYSKRNTSTDPNEANAPNYVGKLCVDGGVRFVKYGSPNMHTIIEDCVSQGVACVLEDVTDVDPALVSLIHKTILTSGSMKILKMGDKEIEYHSNFRLYLTCSSVAEITSELASSCNLVLFELTARAVQEQLLSVIVSIERDRVEAERKRLLVVGVSIGKQLAKVEQDILRVLSSTTGNILDNTEGVNVVKTCKEIANELTEKRLTIVKAEKAMERSRDAYRDVSVHASTIYMSCAGLAILEHMYQFGYEWFVKLLVRVLVQTKVQNRRGSALSLDGTMSSVANLDGTGMDHHHSALDDLEEDDDEEHIPLDHEDVVTDIRARVNVIKNALMNVIYSEVCSSLLSEHRDVFTVLLVVSLGITNKYISPVHWSFLTSQAANFTSAPTDHPASAICGTYWGQVYTLSRLPGFENLLDYIVEHSDAWRALVSGEDITVDAVQGFLKDDHDNIALTSLCKLSPFPGMFNTHVNEQHALFISDPYNLNTQAQPSVSGAVGAACLLKCIRPDKVSLFLLRCCELVLGELSQARHAPFSLHASSMHSEPHIPLLMLLSGGSDPMQAFLAYAKDNNITMQTQITEDPEQCVHTCVSISLGQGQGPIAARAIDHASKYGGWVLLQNCHLAISWLPTLASIYNNLGSNASSLHPSFRLFLTSYPTNSFPLSIARAATTCVQQPPQGLRANLADILQLNTLKKILTSVNNCHYRYNNNVNTVNSGEVPLALLLHNTCISLAVLHCVIKERVEFGPIGMSVPYPFSQSDFDISLKHAVNVFTHTNGNNAVGINDLDSTVLNRTLSLHTIELCINALKYLIGECNYGGRVTDEWDRRVLNTIIDDFLHIDKLTYRYVEALKTPSITCGDTQVTLYVDDIDTIEQWIQSTEVHTHPESVGLHSNATLSREIAKSNALLSSLRLVLQKSQISTSTNVTSASARVHQIIELCTNITSSLPQTFITADQVLAKYPPSYIECMNTVLHHEVDRCEAILNMIHHDLLVAQACVKGESVPSLHMETLIENLYSNQVPESWLRLSGATTLTLAQWISNIAQRAYHLQAWYNSSNLNTFIVWFGGLFFPHGFLTAVMQSYARKNSLAIDLVSIQYGYLHKYDSYRAYKQTMSARQSTNVVDIIHNVTSTNQSDVSGHVSEQGLANVDDGVVIYGLELEGCQWDDELQYVIDMPNGITRSETPAIWLKPCIKTEADESPCFIIDINQHPTYLTASSSVTANTSSTDTTPSAIPNVCVYECPTYRVGTRYGSLLTTGHSTNFIVSIPIPAYSVASKWIKRGAALVAEPLSM